MSPELLTVSLGERAYDIFFGRDIYPVFQEWICRFFPGASVFVISDRNVASIYGDDIRRCLTGIPHSVHAIPAGEEHKTWEAVREIYGFLARGHADRESLVVAFGGGVVGDMAGFAAATYLRGIPHIQVPTTLLAQVDSSVGGKTGFNLPDGKNLVGAFHQPRAVFIDHAFLRTLDQRNLRAGMAEVVKCGIAGDESLWKLVCDRAGNWAGMSDGDWQEAIWRSVAFKAAVVARDERESSIRRVLNLGHTVGHALEQAAGYGRILHGEAVAMGLAWEAVFGRRMGMTPPALEERLCEVLLAMGFALDDPGLALTSIASAIGMDKKRVAAELSLPVVTAPGRCTLKQVPVSVLREELPSIRSAIRERIHATAAGALEEQDLMARIDRGEGGSVVALLERRVADDPRDLRGMLLLAQAYARTGNPAGAWETVKSALERDSADPDAQRLAREIEGTLAAAGGKESPSPLEDVIVLEEGAFALRPAEQEGVAPASSGIVAGPPTARGETSVSGEPGPVEAPGGAPPESVAVRTITMANVYWEQGEKDVARRIVREMLAADPGDARAAAWLAERPETGEEAALAAFLEMIAKEYGHDFSGPH